MRFLTVQDVVNRLLPVQEGALVFVSYNAGRAPTARAIREASPALEAGMNRRHFVGKFAGLSLNQRGEVYFTVLCDNRINENTGSAPHYRSFNPSLGKLINLEVINVS